MTVVCARVDLGVERKRGRLPSSGVMVSWKLSKSAGSGKLVTIVEGRSNSVKSVVARNALAPFDEMSVTEGNVGKWRETPGNAHPSAP